MSSLEALFCHVDDGCRVFEPKLEQTRLWPDNKARKRGKILTLSEIMTILIAFHQNHYRNFKHFCGLIAYSHQPKKPSLKMEWALPPAA